MKCQFDSTTNIRRAEYGDKSPSSSLVNIYSLLTIVATFSQTSAGVIQTDLLIYWLDFVCLLSTCAFPYKDWYVQEWLVGGEVKTNHITLQSSMVFNVQYFQQGDLALLKERGLKLAHCKKYWKFMKFTRQEHISHFYIHASVSDQSIPPIPHHEYICIIQCTINLHCSWSMAATKIKCMYTINVNVICEYQWPMISTIVAVDTLCWRCTWSYNLQVAKQFTHADTGSKSANNARGSLTRTFH